MPSCYGKPLSWHFHLGQSQAEEWLHSRRAALLLSVSFPGILPSNVLKTGRQDSLLMGTGPAGRWKNELRIWGELPAARGAPGGGARVPPRGRGGGRCPGCPGGLRPPRCPRPPPPSSRPPRCPRPRREPRRRTPGYAAVGGYHGVPEAFSSLTVPVFASHAWCGKVAQLHLPGNGRKQCRSSCSSIAAGRGEGPFPATLGDRWSYVILCETWNTSQRKKKTKISFINCGFLMSKLLISKLTSTAEASN